MERDESRNESEQKALEVRKVMEDKKGRERVKRREEK